jgi:hypothetical protein
MTCDICGREMGDSGGAVEWGVECRRPFGYASFVAECFLRGYEREKARADKAEAALAPLSAQNGDLWRKLAEANATIAALKAQLAKANKDMAEAEWPEERKSR